MNIREMIPLELRALDWNYHKSAGYYYIKLQCKFSLSNMFKDKIDI